MARLTQHSGNCGMRNLYIGYAERDPEKILKQLCKSVHCQQTHYRAPEGMIKKFSPRFSHIVFSQAVNHYDGCHGAYGKRLAAYIRKNKLGYVSKSKTGNNPNTQNAITAFVWTLDQEGLKLWWAKRQTK